MWRCACNLGVEAHAAEQSRLLFRVGGVSFAPFLLKVDRGSPWRGPKSGGSLRLRTWTEFGAAAATFREDANFGDLLGAPNRADLHIVHKFRGVRASPRLRLCWRRDAHVCVCGRADGTDPELIEPTGKRIGHPPVPRTPHRRCTILVVGGTALRPLFSVWSSLVVHSNCLAAPFDIAWSGGGRVVCGRMSVCPVGSCPRRRRPGSP